MSVQNKTIKLKYPIPIVRKKPGTEENEVVELKELTLGRLKAKHLRLLPDSFMEDEGRISATDVIPLIAGLADVPEAAVDELDLEDLTGVAESLQSFLGESLPTGKK